MLRFPEVAVIAALLAAPLASPLAAEGLGRTATPEEIAIWDIDVRPDGLGLPPGRGTVAQGDKIFQDRCASCHGVFGEGTGRWPVLAGGQGSLTDQRPVKTIGSYWPYLSTVFDYVNRAMPFGQAQSLEPDEVYAITAYLLYLNDEVDEDFELSADNFTAQHLPNEAEFKPDDRPETELVAFSAPPCMVDCKPSVEITMHAAVLDVTPEETAAKAAKAEKVSADAEQAQATSDAPPAVAVDTELIKAGEKVFRKCKSCHQIGEGAKNRVGPVLTGVVDRPAGAAEGFKYSNALTAAADGGLVWSDATLAEFLRDPRGFLKGTRMSFAGLRKDSDIDAIIAYLRSSGG